MNIKLVCFDLDGTINDDWKLNPLLEHKLLDIKIKGIQTAIVTGRETIGTLFFVKNSQFPFDYIGCGGGYIFQNPQKLLEQPLKDIINLLFTEQTARYGGLSKVGRLLEIIKLSGFSEEETLLIDDNNNETTDIQEIEALTKCHLASPLSHNTEWIKIVKDRKGLVSLLHCGMGTVQILNTIFKK